MFKKIIFIIMIGFIFNACSKKIDSKDPVLVVENFILLCEKGQIDEAQKLLAKKHNLDYFKKYKDKNSGKDLFYIDYDYKKNDDVIELSYKFLKEESSPTIAVVKLNSNYKKQNAVFEKEIILHKENDEWKIYDFLFMPVKVM
ncbi:DUF4878 domain-containing protein [Campylobacter sp. FMV-PI01]|uniref:DUF4878 domain-containing protein n=1 Tax=Campylobacter portucalensis TaxID=2608384 RepID=A0A6L5WHG8_9BACT|nr:DUF4878 domain-containing protein [Campylobacter portucalensis]MSN96668.1 DUF4878 domain-containing protein [Campylobacter portucalensis]